MSTLSRAAQQSDTAASAAVVARATVPEETVVSMLGGLTGLDQGARCWTAEREAAGITTSGGTPTGKIEIYEHRSKYVPQEFITWIEAALSSNEVISAKATAWPSMQGKLPPTSTEMWALALAICDMETVFALEPASYRGAFPNGQWTSSSNADGGVGPMQITRSQHEFFGGHARLWSDPLYNMKCGIYELWSFACGAEGLSWAVGESGPHTFGNTVPDRHFIAAFNRGCSSSRVRADAASSSPGRSYSYRVYVERYPWYLKQLQGSAASASTGAGTLGSAIVDVNLHSGDTLRQWRGSWQPVDVACVYTARTTLLQAMKRSGINTTEGAIEELIPRGLGGAQHIGRHIRSKFSSGWRPKQTAGWYSVAPGSPNGLAFATSSTQWGHVYLLVNGLRYDQFSVRDGGGKSSLSWCPPFFQICHPQWGTGFVGDSGVVGRPEIVGQGKQDLLSIEVTR